MQPKPWFKKVRLPKSWCGAAVISTMEATFLGSCVCHSGCTAGEYLQSGAAVGRRWTHHPFLAGLAFRLPSCTVSELLAAGASWCWIFQLIVRFHSHLSIWLSRQSLFNRGPGHKPWGLTGQQWDVLVELCWGCRVFTDQGWVDWRCCLQGKLPSLSVLALTSPSFLCARAGEGCACGSRRSRAEPGSQEC